MCFALSVSHNLTKATQPWLVLLPLERINSLRACGNFLLLLLLKEWKHLWTLLYVQFQSLNHYSVCLGLFWHQFKCSGLQHLFICLTLVLNFQKKPLISIQSLSCFSENQHPQGFREYSNSENLHACMDFFKFPLSSTVISKLTGWDWVSKVSQDVAVEHPRLCCSEFPKRRQRWFYSPNPKRFIRNKNRRDFK